jgi:AraC-like DNA-binding protein
VADIENPKLRLKADAQVKVLELAARELQDECLGFHLARDFELGQIGLVYYVMASSEQLADALRNAERYCAINDEGIRLRVSADRTVSIGLEYLNIDRPYDHHHIEFWLVTLVRVCRAITRARLAPKQIKVKHLRTQTPPDVRRHLGCEIDFGADIDEILFPPPIGALPVVGADNHLNSLLLQYASEALGKRARRPSILRHQVEEQIAQLLPHGKASVSEIARRLGMSRRTLVRAMSDEGATFSTVLKNLRVALAKRYLSEEELPISEIAWLLGYREISSFTHAFARWTGLAPREFRACSPARRTGARSQVNGLI